MQISHLMKIRAVGAELFRADRRTDTTKLIVDFLNFTTHSLNLTKNTNYLFRLY